MSGIQPAKDYGFMALTMARKLGLEGALDAARKSLLICKTEGGKSWIRQVIRELEALQ